MFEVVVTLGIIACVLGLVALAARALRRPAVSARYHIYYEVSRALDGKPIVCYLVPTVPGGEDVGLGQRVTTRGFATYQEAVAAATECGEAHQRDVDLALKSITDPATYLPDPRPIDPIAQ